MRHTDMSRAMDDAMRTDLAVYLCYVPPRPPGRKATKGEPREIAAADALDALGLRAWAPAGLRLVRRGKRRRPDVVEEVLAPGALFLWCDPEGFHRAMASRQIGPTFRLLGRKDKRDVEDWMGAVEDQRSAVERARRRGEAECQFKAGDTLRVMSGPLVHTMARFLSFVRDTEGTPQIVAEAEFFGGTRKVRLDPLDVREEK